MTQETELKLALHPQDLPRLLAHPLLTARAAQRKRLRNTYFDTATLALLERRLALRERQIGRRTLLTVKTAGHSVSGLSRRGEWEAPTTPGQFDFAALVEDSALAQWLTRLTWQLVPVFRTDFTRRSWLIDHLGAQVEVALDQGFVAVGAARGSCQEPILELELELRSGPLDALLDLAHTLALGPQGEAASGLRLHPDNRSKAERGYALFQGLRPLAVKAQALQLTPELHPVHAFRAAALDCLTHLQANATGTRVAAARGAAGPLPDPEFVHQARVALRRLRTGLRLFSAHLPGAFVAHWQLRWAALARLLGEARNWDVLATEGLPALLDEGPQSPQAQALVQWVDDARRAANERAQSALESADQALDMLAFTRALLKLEPGSRQPAPRSLEGWALRTLRQRHKRLLQQTRLALQEGPDGRHALRIALKKLRYAQEFLSSLLPSRHQQRSSACWEQAQDLLGRLNDLSTAQTLLEPCPLAAPLLERLQQQLALGLQELPRIERALLSTPTPWD